jgi:hypothetical protein
VTSFDADLHRLATQLAAMIAAPAITAAADDTEFVNLARRTVRNCYRAMLTDLAPISAGQHDGPPQLTDLALNPVGVLHLLLQPDPPPLDPTAATQRRTTSTEAANEQWKHLAHAAEIVTHEWTSSDPASRPARDHAWTRIADVAALAEAAATLDRHLVDANKAPRRLLEDSATIALAAEHARRHTISGPLPNPEPLRPPPHQLTPLAVRDLPDLPAGLSRLGMLITAARHLQPGMVGALAAAHARTLDTLAAALTATSPPAHRAGRRRYAAALQSHGQALNTLRIACRTLSSLDRDDPRPAVQMRDIRTALHPLANSPSLAERPDNQKALLAALRPALAVTIAVDTTAKSQVRSGRWLMPADDERLRWKKISGEHPVNEALDHAALHARALSNQLPAPTAPGTPYRTPHEILTPAIHHSRTTRSSDSIATPTL